MNRARTLRALRHTVGVTALALVATSLSVTTGHAEEGDPAPLPEYRIVEGTIGVDYSWSGGCTAGNGSCADTGYTSHVFNEQSSARLRVQAPGEWTPWHGANHTVHPSAPLVFTSWDYDTESVWRYSDHCGTATYTHETVSGVEFSDSLWQTLVTLTPAPQTSVSVSLYDWWGYHEDWDQGWVPYGYHTHGAYDTDYANEYPRIKDKWSWTGTDCWEPHSDEGYRNIEYLYGNSWYSPSEVRRTGTQTTVTKLDGCTVGSCRWRVDGTDTFAYRATDADLLGYTGTGSATTTWSYVVEGRNLPACDVHSRFDSFDAGPADAPTYRFTLETVWCEGPDGTLTVQSTVAEGATQLSPMEAALSAAIREFLTYHDSWRPSRYDVSGDTVTADGKVDICFGIPILGKVKWVKKFPKLLRFTADLLRKANKGVLDKVATGLDWAAKQVDRVLDGAGKVAKRLARAAINAVGDLIGALPLKTQVNLLLITVGVIADWHTSGAWARSYVKSLALKDLELLLSKADPLEKLFSDELVCFRDWTPRIVQTLVPGQQGEFVDVPGDNPAFEVRRSPTVS